MRLRPVVFAAPLVLLSFAASASGSEEDPYAKQMEAKAASIVSVKAVVKYRYEGGVGDYETTNTNTGVLVDPSGVVMFPSWGGVQPPGSSSRTRIVPVSIRILFQDDEKEYDAVLGATDPQLGLAFAKMKDTSGRKIAPVDFADFVDVKVGDELFGVTRTDQGFDYAPYYGVTKVVGQVTRPRPMFLVSGFLPICHPLFVESGKVAGLVVRQSGVSDEEGGLSAGMRWFLLPGKAASLVIQQGVAASHKALEAAIAAEKEAAKEAAKDAAMDGAKTTGAGEAGMDETPPAGMDGR